MNDPNGNQAGRSKQGEQRRPAQAASTGLLASLFDEKLSGVWHYDLLGLLGWGHSHRIS
ncbi:MAG TPA: hypothetical protein VMU98_02670 [Acidimicrobiales bacterium]|nr:hypothetical protein [Acidimicrobiales bacterium]